MRAVYEVEQEWVELGAPIARFIETCELGVRTVLHPMHTVIRAAANNYVKNYCHPQYIEKCGFWGQHTKVNW